VDSRLVELGRIEDVLIKARTLIEQVDELSFLPGKVVIKATELPDEPLVFQKGRVVTTAQLYDPDQDSKVQPPRGIASGFFTLAG
jgi:hypothetical protein